MKTATTCEEGFHQSTEPLGYGYRCLLCKEVVVVMQTPLRPTAEMCGPGAYSNEYD